MPRTKKFAELAAPILADPARLARVEQHRYAMRAAIRLAELRNELGMTQSELAETLGVTQTRVSQIERAENPYLETLREYVEALGGELEIRAVFPEEIVPLVVSGK